jgi:quinol-cytochrome oxidoreductase complex cytochrome b subunit
MGMGRRVIAWLDERYQLAELKDFAERKTVPMRHTIWYYFGGITLFLFLIQVTTGILLLLYYRPTEAQAYESVQYIVAEVPFGWLVRSVHSWAANLLIGAAAIHMFSVFFLKAYRKPRELTWLSGMVLLGIFMGFGFTGYLLPWNQLAFSATKVGTEMVSVIPVVGDTLMRMIRGGEHVTGATLTRMFGFHVALLPAITTLLLALHLIFVQRQGMSGPLRGEEPKQMPFFPNFVLRDLMVWMVVLCILGALSLYFPWDLGVKADPVAPAPGGIEPEWYFLFVFQALRIFPSTVLGLDGRLVLFGLLGILALSWTLVPWLDRRAADGKPSRLINWAGVVLLAAVITLTVWAKFFHHA